MPNPIPRVARKTITTIQEGSVYKERWAAPAKFPPGYTVRNVFYDSAKNQLASVDGTLEGNQVLFSTPYDDVAVVPNGAMFDCLVTDLQGDDHLFRYGTVFRRQNFYPNSTADAAVRPAWFVDGFQRPAGPLGSNWVTLVGQARIFDNVGLLGDDGPNTVGPNYNFFSRYFVRYIDPCASDTFTVSLSVIDKGPGTTIFTVATNSDATSYLYVGWHSPTLGSNTVEIGYGTSPDIGSMLSPADVLFPQDVETMNISDDQLDRFRLRYSDSTKTFALYNEDGSDKYLSWTDESELVAHGKGCRGIGLGGNTGLFNSGVQVAYMKVMDDV